MHVTTYITRDNPNAVNKTLEEVQSFECRALDPIDEIAPFLKFNKDDFNMNVNFCYIEAFDCYYFINDKILQDGGIIILQCSIDALYTCRNELIECRGVAVRNEKIGLNDVIDTNYPIPPNNCNITYKKLADIEYVPDYFFIGIL